MGLRAVAPSEQNPGSHAEFFSKSDFRFQISIVLLVIVFFGLIRWRLADMPLERDEGEYAYAGQLMLEGIPPYKLAYNMKLPGTYAAYAVLMAPLGQTPKGIHLGLLLVNAATAVMIFFLTRRLFDPVAATVAAITYALLSTHQSTLGFAAHATHFVTICAVGGLILLLRGLDSDRVITLFASGLLFGLAFLMKQPGIFFGLFGLLYLIFECVRQCPSDWSKLAKYSVGFLLGCGLPFLITCSIMWRAGVFNNFWFWTFSYARQYSGLVSLKDGWDLFTFHFWPMLKAAPLVWAITLLGITAIFWYRAGRQRAVLLLGFLVFSCVAVSSGLYFRSHYFVVALPAMALLTGLGVAAAQSLIPNESKLRFIPAIVFAGAFAWAVVKNEEFYFRLTPIEACNTVYVNSPFVDAVTISKYLEQHTSATDRIMVLGSEPEIYFYAHRLSASGYIYAYPLMENQPFWEQMQSAMMQEVESSKPAYVVYFNHPAAFLTTMGSSRLAPYLNWANAYLKSEYELVGRADLATPESHYFWGDEVKKTQPQTQYYTAVFKRKD